MKLPIRIAVVHIAWSYAIVLNARRSNALSGLIKRSFTLAGHRTSVALEQEFWTALSRMAQARGQNLSALVASADAVRGAKRPLASALRVMALEANVEETMAG
jgi:predicted DNA-binding ribbon-helix-helix protein